MSKIASRYGVTVADIKKWNKLKSNKLRRGQKLKINIVETVAAPPVTQPDKTAEQPTQTPELATDSATDSATVNTTSETLTDTVADVAPVTPAVPEKAAPAPKAVKEKPKATPKKSESRSKSKTKTHTVAKGETLWKIAKSNGISVEQLQKANGLNSKSKIRPGQKLKIPRK